MSLRVVIAPPLIGAAFCCAASVGAAAERTTVKRYYHLPRGDAATMLRQFAAISGSPVLFMMDKVQGEQTNAVDGEYSQSEALKIMLAGTSLEIMQEAEIEGFVVGRRTSSVQREVAGKDLNLQPKSDHYPGGESGKNESKMNYRTAKLMTLLLALFGVGSNASDGQVAPANEHAAPATDVTTTTTVAPSDMSGSTIDTQSERPVTLSPFQVNADSNTGYGSSHTTSAARISQAYIDVPQTVNVVTSEFINDYNLQNELEIFNWIPNLMVAQADSPTTNTLRGLTITLNYIDGVQTGFGSFAMPTQFYDRVEVVKGPSSAAFGIGEPAGIINYVSKTPTGADKTIVTAGVGDWNNYLANVDSQGHMINHPNITYRIAAFWDSGGSEIHGENHSGEGGLLALRDDVNSTTSVQLITSYSSVTIPAGPDNSTIWQNETAYTSWLDTAGPGQAKLPGSNPTPSPAPGYPGGTTSSTWAGGDLISWNHEPLPDGWNGSTNNSFRANFIVDESLADNHIHVRNTGVIENETLNSYIEQITNLTNPSPGVYDVAYSRSHNNKNGNYRSDNVDIDAEYDFGVAGKYTTLVGGDANLLLNGGYSISLPDINADGSIAVENLYNINYKPPYFPVKPITNSSGVTYPAQTYATLHTGKQSEYGFYVQEEASYFGDFLTLTAGWRIDKFDNYTDNLITNAKTIQPWESTKGAPRFAATIKPEKWLSFYGLVTEHKDPVQVTYKYTDFAANDIQPATIAQYNNFQTLEYYQPTGTLVEGGVKATFFNGDVTASFCVFHETSLGNLYLQGISVKDPDGSTTQIVENLVTGANVHGYEAEIAGRLSKRLTFVADYAISRGTYAPFNYMGTPEPNDIDPPVTISGHAKYDFGNLSGRGFYATFGGKWWGQYQLNTGGPIYVWYNSSQYSVDGGLGFKWSHGRQRIYLNVDNFTNQHDLIGVIQNYVTGPDEQAFLTYTREF